ncbi:patatin-like phospholipase family protein [Limibaculum sp. M0105]|uniref:Patatin-like phospholipase family protein n=1 Tax=Thermohalobaculum xanthum TaxID=2753746 RepID=A0A8J7M3Y3_9RHOB|nr:patatin-like phospholipase family protein [Thermohalobaculum xanthum]MBK0397759.1 patatin-like phospholipase family protein [Thermohalobaculum xanthum]
MAAIHQTKSINLALQGGGAHGAFTWGALDRLLEEERLDIEAISGTSAGAMNAAMLKTGYLGGDPGGLGGREGARAQLAHFWGEIRRAARRNAHPVVDWLGAFSPGIANMVHEAMRLPMDTVAATINRSLSPYQWNPLNLNPLGDLLRETTCFDRICRSCYPHIFVSATNVRTGRIKVFKNGELTVDVFLASACLPFLFQAVEIDGEHYWDGGYMGNPALFPLFYETGTDDILIVHVNPIERPEVPQTANDIINRVNEISFNSSLLRELRAIAFVGRLIEEGKLSPSEMKAIRIHAVRDDETMRELGFASKLNPRPGLFDDLKAAGRAAADSFLRAHWDKIGVRGSVDIRAMLY